MPSCNNAGVYLTSYTDARTSLSYIIGYPWPTYIRWRVTYYLPLITQSLKNCISIAGLILMLHLHWQLMRMRVPLIRARSPMDTSKQASKHTNRNFSTQLPSVGLAQAGSPQLVSYDYIIVTTYRNLESKLVLIMIAYIIIIDTHLILCHLIDDKKCIAGFTDFGYWYSAIELVLTRLVVLHIVFIYRNRRNFHHGLIFVNFGHTKNTEVYSAHVHAMPLEIVLHRPE